MNDDQIVEMWREVVGYGHPGDIDRINFARAIIAQARAQLIAEQWIPVANGEPNCEGQYVIRINKHGHIRLGQRVLNSDTLRHQWQVDGEVCKTVTHYHPIPPLTLSKE